MPFSVRTRSALRAIVLTLTATAALLGIADTASAAGVGQVKVSSANVRAESAAFVAPACGNCGTGF
jgi:hypothetical protein